MIDHDNIVITYKSDKELVDMFFKWAEKQNKKKRKKKKAKVITEVGKYCPKEKFGQCWAYAKDVKEDEEMEEVA